MNTNLTLKPGQAGKLLKGFFAAGAPVLLVGAPGVGKSDIVSGAAKEAGMDLILSHPVVSDPTDAKGLPWINAADTTEATFLPFGDLARAIKADRPTVWFLDDLGQASPAVQASYMQLLLARRVNGHVLPDCVTFAAATNRRTDRAGVQGILEPVKSRFTSIIEIEPSLDDWCSWAFRPESTVPPELVAFLRFRPDLLHNFVPSADLQNTPSPRTWANAGKILTMNLPADIELPALAGAVGMAAAAELSSFLRIYRELPSIDGILLDPDNAGIPTGPSTLYAVAAGLAHRANAANFDRVCRYTERLANAGHGEFAVLLFRDATRRTPALLSTPAGIKTCSGPLSTLISGAAA